jgi:predicted nucleic-acid-binding protein
MIRIDTNYIIRYLVNDNIEMADIAENILTTKNIFIANEILAEVVYVLLGVYEIKREDISTQLINPTSSSKKRKAPYIALQHTLKKTTCTTSSNYITERGLTFSLVNII